MLRVGQLSALWNVAQETNLTFNLVRLRSAVILIPILVCLLALQKPADAVVNRSFELAGAPSQCRGLV